MVPVFKNVVERSTAKNYCTVTLLSVVSKVPDHLEKYGLFSDISTLVSRLLDQLHI